MYTLVFMYSYIVFSLDMNISILMYDQCTLVYNLVINCHCECLLFSCCKYVMLSAYEEI